MIYAVKKSSLFSKSFKRVGNIATGDLASMESIIFLLVSGKFMPKRFAQQVTVRETAGGYWVTRNGKVVLILSIAIMEKDKCNKALEMAIA